MDTMQNAGSGVWITIICLAVYSLAVIENTYGYNFRMKRRLKELASPEQFEFLKEHLRLPKIPKLMDLVPYGLSVLLIPLFLHASAKEGDVPGGIAILLALGLAYLATVAIVGVFHVIATWKAPDWYEVDKKIRVKNFLTTKQLNFLLKKVDKTKQWGSTYGDVEKAAEKEIWNPDKLVPLLKMKSEMNRLIELSETYETLHKKGSEYTFEQLERKTKLYARLLKEYMLFLPHFRELMEASSHKQLRDGLETASDQTTISGDNFDKVEQKILSSLSAIEATKPVKTEVREPFRELERVVESKAVSEETRQQASVLLEQIQTMNEKAEVQREREMEEMEAQSIIQANKLHYAVPEETQ